MTRPILRFTTAELYGVLPEIDPVGVLAEEFVARQQATRGSERGSRLVPWPEVDPAADLEHSVLALLEDSTRGARCVLPRAALQVTRTAALAALAARELVVPGVVTAAVLGSGKVAQLHLEVIARHVPGVSHVAASPFDHDDDERLDPQVTNRLDLAGIGLSVTKVVDEAVLGASLVIAAEGVPQPLDAAQLTSGSVVVNSAGVDLPDTVVDGVDDVYVDDAALLEDNRHRAFVRTHLDGSDGAAARWGEGSGWRNRRRIKADLGQVLAGEKSGRRHVDDVVLVELLGVRELDVRFASTLHQAAVERGLGTPVREL